LRIFHRYLFKLKNIYPQKFLCKYQVKMALWKYFNSRLKLILPSPSGSLSGQILTNEIVTTNKEVQHVMEAKKMKHCSHHSVSIIRVITFPPTLQLVLNCWCKYILINMMTMDHR